MNRIIRSQGPSIAYALLIFILSSLPSLKSPDLGVAFQDKIYHVLEYAVLGSLLQRGSEISGQRSAKRFLLISLIGVCYGASDEIHQRFVPGRQCEFLDFLSDSAGILAGQALYSAGRMLKNTRKKNN